MSIKIGDLNRWIDEAVKDDEGFQTKSLDPETQTAKEMIRKIIRRLKGRID
jgi:hypothetical protein